MQLRALFFISFTLIFFFSCKNPATSPEEEFMINDFLSMLDLKEEFELDRVVIESDGIGKFINYNSLDIWNLVEIDSTTSDSIVISYQVLSDYSIKTYNCYSLQSSTCFSNTTNGQTYHFANISYLPLENRMQLFLPSSLLPSFGLSEIETNSDLHINFEFNRDTTEFLFVDGIESYDEFITKIQSNGYIEMMELKKGTDCKINYTFISDYSPINIPNPYSFFHSCTEKNNPSFSIKVKEILDSLNPLNLGDELEIIRIIRGKNDLSDYFPHDWSMKSNEVWTLVSEDFSEDELTKRLLFHAIAFENYYEYEGKTIYDLETNSDIYKTLIDTTYSDSSSYEVSLVFDFMKNQFRFNYPEEHYKKGYLSDNKNIPLSNDRIVGFNYKSEEQDLSIEEEYYSSELGYFYGGFNFYFDNFDFRNGTFIEIGTPHSSTNWSFSLYSNSYYDRF